MTAGGKPGQRLFADDTSEYNAIAFVFRMLLGNAATATLVQVKAVHPPQGVAQNTGTVDVLPLVNQMDSSGVATPHEVIYGLPYFRLQGGSNAVIVDPAVNDIGMAAFASRDISSVKSTRGQANPGSRRRFDYADGMYFGGLLNGTPVQYVEFLPNNGGISIVDGFKNSIVMNAAGIVITDVNGNVINMSLLGVRVTALGSTIGVTTHTHDQPNDGHGDSEAATDPPNNGS